jgi:hypothetical protein
MKQLSLSLRVLASIVFAFLAASPLPAQEPLQAPELLPAQVPVEEPILERYTLGVGVHSDGVAAVLSDRFFGGGTAQAVLAYLDTAPRKNLIDLSGSLVINVSRRVRTGEVTLALLCTGVRVRGLDAAGSEMFVEELPPFTFGDSQGGRYTQVLRKISLFVSTVEVTFFGNYE